MLELLLIICFVIGSALILVEAFMPGFGVAGIAGIILEVIGIINVNSLYGGQAALIATFLVLLLVGLAVFLSYRSAVKGRLSKSPLILKEEASAAPAGDVSALQSWIGRDGVVATALRPVGFIEIGNARLSASTTGAFLDKGTAVHVEGVEGDHLLVFPKV
jgi:membrane-bound ClpP family serine protease